MSLYPDSGVGSQSNNRWVRLGCMLLNDLLASPDGIRFLQEDEFLDQLMKSFAQLDPVSENLYHLRQPNSSFYIVQWYSY